MQLILQPVADTFLSSIGATSNFGTTASNPVGVSFSILRFRMLLRFDLSAVPAGATVSTAELTLFSQGTGTVSNSTFRARRCTRNDWTELGATWNQYNGMSNWATAGADFTTENQASFTTAGTTVTDLVFDDATALVSDAITNRAGQLDVLVMANTETGSHNITVYSSEHTVVAQRPRLVINYAFLTRSNLTGGFQELTGNL